MFSLSRIAVFAALFASTTLAAGNIFVINACTFPVYYKLADNKGTNNNIGTIVASGGIYREAQDTNGGRSIELAKDTSAFSNFNPILQLEYSVSGGTIYYGLSTVDGNPFSGYGVQVMPSDHSCETLYIGTPQYQNKDGSGVVATCGAATDLDLYFC